MNNLMEQYALIDNQIKQLTLEKDSLKLKIIKELIEQNVEKVETGFGKFTISKLKSWDYPEYVELANEEYKTLKAKAEQTGDATYTETESLRFTPIKF